MRALMRALSRLAPIASGLGLALAILTAPALVTPTRAAPGDNKRTVDPDWPCPQRRVPTLSSTQIWDGPPVDDINDWAKDEAVAKLVAKLANRRIPQADAVELIKGFAASVPAAERDAKLANVFAGLLATVNAERSVVINGIIRFEQRQRSRSAELEREGTRIGELKKTAESDPKAKAELDNAQQLFDWNVRVFQERQSSTPIACEIPVLMESRIFELAREIRALITG